VAQVAALNLWLMMWNLFGVGKKRRPGPAVGSWAW
jgi:hypothetical protein